MKLMIVESPNKIKKLRSLLAGGWEFAASIGHIRDMPVNELGVDLDTFTPTYELLKDKKKVVSVLREKAARAETIYLATDDDREGEAIAWHLKETLNLQSYKRITFTSITKSALDTAIQNASDALDMNKVRAQETRRVLDRLVGYLVSPVISSQALTRLSAGRVQSPALKILVLLSRRIQNFRSRKFYELTAKLPCGTALTLSAGKHAPEDGKHIFDRSVVERIAEETEIELIEVETSEVKIAPRSPFITSTLLQAAGETLNLSAEEVMKAAQTLFEAGLITYHRTDSPNLSEESFEQIKEYLEGQGIVSQEKQLKHKAKEGAQEGHEGIRVTDIAIEEADTGSAALLYGLIRERTLCSVADHGKDQVLEIKGKNRLGAEFKAKKSVVITPGWRSLAKVEHAKLPDGDTSTKLSAGMTFTTEMEIKERATTPPKAMGEHDLVAALEKLGIGRPSTYSSIIHNIVTRKYVNKVRKGSRTVLEPTPLGEALCDGLNVMTFMNLEFTKIIEGQLDAIASGKMNPNPLIAGIYSNLKDECNELQFPRLVETKPCPGCGGELVLRTKGKSKFFVHVEGGEGCSTFISEAQGEPVFREIVLSACPSCGAEIQRKYSEKKDFHFWVHTGEHSCAPFISDCDGEPQAVK